MKIKYDKETDVMYIKFSDAEVEESLEEKSGVIIDFDKEGNVVGIELINVSKSTTSPNSIIYEIA
ncbi:MAG TPA: DUF2283 domain-containing protein [Ignavibacteria bacterium]|nr:DUF2283 domain-containing protein [Ignavibacteria bacterium]